jgi:pseudaminic acid cytidylyltransferase
LSSIPDKVLAIIPARGGSKRIPQKNIKSFLGKPIIAYSIQTAFGSGIFNNVMVSTDSAEIEAVAVQYGADVPFRRTQKSSDDFATTAEVLLEVLANYREKGEWFEYVCCIYPTAPFISMNELSDAYKILRNSDFDSVIPVVKFSYPIWRSLKLNENSNLLKPVWPEFMNTRSQDLPNAYHDCGQFYFFKTQPFLESHLLFTQNTYGLEKSELAVQDIDVEADWKIAEMKYKSLFDDRDY